MAPKASGGDRTSHRIEAHADLIPAPFEARPEIVLHERRERLAERYGRALRGQRCRIAVPHGHYKTTTITAALRTSGLTAATLFDCATNGDRFRAYVTDIPVPLRLARATTTAHVPKATAATAPCPPPRAG